MTEAAGATSMFEPLLASENFRAFEFSLAPGALELSDAERILLKDKAILVVEDEVFIAVDVAGALEAVGARVTHARSLRIAQTILEENTFDAAVLDVTLGPSHTCEPIADTLRQRGTPFVLHSGDLDRQGEVIASLGAPVVPKPAPPQAVVSALAKHLSERGANH